MNPGPCDFRISLGNQIGEGAFGRVMMGVMATGDPATSGYVAVKMLKEDAAEQELEDLIQVCVV